MHASIANTHTHTHTTWLWQPYYGPGLMEWWRSCRREVSRLHAWLVSTVMLTISAGFNSIASCLKNVYQIGLLMHRLQYERAFGFLSAFQLGYTCTYDMTDNQLYCCGFRYCSQS